VVEGLGGYLAGVIHAHQGSRVASLDLRERGFGQIGGRGLASHGRVLSIEGTEPSIHGDDEGVQ
jgi:hypothetical protein